MSLQDRGTVSLALERLNGNGLALDVARPAAYDSASYDFPRLASPNAPGNIEIGLRRDIGNDRNRPEAEVQKMQLKVCFAAYPALRQPVPNARCWADTGH